MSKHMLTSKSYEYWISMEDKQKKIRKLKIFGKKDEKAIIAIGGRASKNIKVIIKALTEGTPEQHLTMLIKPNGAFDFHITKEGKNKTYTPSVQGKIDFQKLSEI